MTPSLAALTVAPDATLLDALAAIDAGAAGLCVIAADDGTLVGVLTDGDIRRAVLRGGALTDAALPIATTAPVTVGPDASRAGVLDVMRARRLSAVPIVDAERRLLGLHTLSDITGPPVLPNVAVIMAGGRGTRLGPLTASTPKPLIEVAGRPIIEWVILELVGSGIRTVHVSVGHLAEQIVERLGDGESLGCRIEYLREDPELPLGTGGPLALLHAARPDLADPIVVMNADLMVRLDVGELLAVHARSGAAITVGTRPYEHRIPFGVLETEDGRVTAITEKPAVQAEVSGGIYAVDPGVLDLVPAGVASTMPELVERCIAKGHAVRTWAIRDEWIDVGTPSDLTRARFGA